MNPEITLPKAIEWTRNWRNSEAYANMGIKAFAFKTEDLKALIDTQQPDMVRFYLGINSEGQYQLIYVGVDTNGNDMLNVIHDFSFPCPSTCPPNSPLL